MDAIDIRDLQAADVEGCRAVLEALPDWFGIPEAIDGYVTRLSALDGYVAIEGGRVVACLGLKRHGPRSIEIDVIAVRPELHRAGLGALLVEHAAVRAQAVGCSILHMKTIGPSSDDTNYAKTRLFWEAVGFVPMEEMDIWTPTNPCLLMVKPL